MPATSTRTARTSAAAALLTLAAACSSTGPDDPTGSAADGPGPTTPSSTAPAPSTADTLAPGTSAAAPEQDPAGVAGSRASDVADLQQSKCAPFLAAVGEQLGLSVTPSQLDARQSCVSSREPGSEVVLVSLALAPRTEGSSCEPVAMTGPSSLTVDGGGTPEIRTVTSGDVTGTLITTPPAGGELVACTDDVVYDIQYLASTGQMPDFAALLAAALAT